MMRAYPGAVESPTASVAVTVPGPVKHDDEQREQQAREGEQHLEHARPTREVGDAAAEARRRGRARSRGRGRWRWRATPIRGEAPAPCTTRV